MSKSTKLLGCENLGRSLRVKFEKLDKRKTISAPKKKLSSFCAKIKLTLAILWARQGTLEVRFEKNFYVFYLRHRHNHGGG